MDKGYVDFKQLFLHFHRQRAFFVTRAKDNMKYGVEEHPVDKVQELLAIPLSGDGTEKPPDGIRIHSVWLCMRIMPREMSIGS